MKQVLFFLLILNGFAAHGQTSTARTVRTNGHCSPATTGNNNVYYFTYCGSDPLQERRIVELLNKILNNSSSAAVNAKLDELLSVVSRPLQSQVNSGGVNIQQVTTGNGSPIINSPITVGKVPTQLSEQHLAALTTFFLSAPNKAEIIVRADQMSDIEPLPKQFYESLRDGGWKMVDQGVSPMTSFLDHGSRFQGAAITISDVTPKTDDRFVYSTSSPIARITSALDALKIPYYLQSSKNQRESLIEVWFLGGFPALKAR